jgi:hypothetical protein
MNEQVDVGHRSQAQDTIQSRDKIGTFDQEAINPVRMELPKDKWQFGKFRSVRGTDTGIGEKVSLNFRRIHASASA